MTPDDLDRYREDPAVDRIVQDPIELPADAWSDGYEDPKRYAGAVVRDDDRGVLYVRNGWSDGWIVPGGNVEAGETCADAAVREIGEETGVEATVERPLCVAEQTFEYAGIDRSRKATFVLFESRADEPTIDPSPVASETIEDVAWFPDPPSPLDPDHAPVFERYL